MQHLRDNLLQDNEGPPSKQCSTLNYPRKDYAPRTQGIRKPNGQISTKANKLEVLATHLKKHVWNHRDLPPSPKPLFSPGSYRYTEQELMMASKIAKPPDQTNYLQKYGKMPLERYIQRSWHM